MKLLGWLSPAKTSRPGQNNVVAAAKVFFALSAVRFNSSVTFEQNHGPSPLVAKSPITAGANDRIRPSQKCSPHPGKKQREHSTTQPKNDQRSEKW